MRLQLAESLQVIFGSISFNIYAVLGELLVTKGNCCIKKEQHLKNALKNCKYPIWALNRIQKKINNPGRKQAPTNRTSNNTQKKSYIVVPYYSGLSESIKNIGRKFGVQVYCKEAPLSRTSWWLPKTKIQSRNKVGSSTDIIVTGWIVMRNILESPQELLEKGSRNIWNPTLPYMTTVTSVVTVLPSTISKLFGGRTWTR